MKQWLASIALAAVLPSAAAQQHAARPGPSDPAAPVPQANYDSAFTGYVPWREQELAGWRDVNDEVARIGGHVKMFGGAGHGGAKPAPARPAAGEPAAAKHPPAGQPPARGAQQAPQGSHTGH